MWKRSCNHLSINHRFIKLHEEKQQIFRDIYTVHLHSYIYIYSSFIQVHLEDFWSWKHRYSTFKRILELVKIAVVPLTSNLHVFHSDVQNLVTYVYICRLETWCRSPCIIYCKWHHWVELITPTEWAWVSYPFEGKFLSFRLDVSFFFFPFVHKELWKKYKFTHKYMYYCAEQIVKWGKNRH